ncbi:MAG: Bug family tripartite tricarboxylate transporter substrate binding protein, partial [Lautropia sp.]
MYRKLIDFAVGTLSACLSHKQSYAHQPAVAGPAPQHRFRSVVGRTIAASLVLWMGSAAAQTAIRGPVRLVVPFGAGTSTDTLARVLAETIASETGQSVVVENKPGGEGIIGAQSVATAASGGTTLLISSNSTQVLNVHLYRKLPYDPIKDFVPVRGLAQTSMGVAVNAASPWRTFGELLAAVRKDPGKLSFASATAVTRLAGEMFKQQAGVQMLNVPYKSNSLSVNALLGREIDVIFVDPVQVLPHMRPEPKLRLLAVTGSQR